MKLNVVGATGRLGRKVMQALIDGGAAPEDLYRQRPRAGEGARPPKARR